MYFFSAYRKQTKPNKLIPLNLRRGYAECYALMMAIAFGIIGVIMVVAYIRQEPKPLAISQANCVTVCHWGEVPTIKGYEDYKKAHPSPAEKRRALKVMSDKHLLEDLISVL